MKKAANIQGKTGWGKHPIQRRLEYAGIKSVASLARQIGCSRRSVYEALEKPSRFSRVAARLEELLNA